MTVDWRPLDIWEMKEGFIENKKISTFILQSLNVKCSFATARSDQMITKTNFRKVFN